MPVPDFLAYARMPGPIQTAIGTMGTIEQQEAERQRMGAAQAAEQRAEALAPYQLQTAQQTAEEQPIKFKSDLANAVMTRRLQAAQAQKALTTDPFTSLKGAAADAYSLEALKNKFGLNSDIYQNALKEFTAGIAQKKARAAFFGSNVWQKNWTQLQKTQYNEDWQKENAARAAKGLPPLTSEQFAVAAGYKPPAAETKADAVNAHIDETQLNQLKNGQPITPAHHILNHIIQGGDPTQLPGAQGEPIKPDNQIAPPSIPPGQAFAQLAPLPPGLQETAPAGTPAPPAGTTAQPPQTSQTTPISTTGTQLLTTPQYGVEAGQTGLSTLRQTSDAQNRSKINYGNQAENTIQNMIPDLDTATAYSGPGGWAQFQADQKMFQHIGKAPPRYLAFHRFMANAGILGDQITQYFGKSIMPSAREELDQVVNPKIWIESPEVAKTKFNAFVKTLRQEINIRKDALKNPEVYYSEKTRGPKSYSDVDYQTTAKKYGMTVPQLKKYIASQRGK